MNEGLAVLFLVFNRPMPASRVFEKIRLARPSKLFIAADGPRFPLKNEFELCEQVRSIVALVDWPCEVKTLFQNKNLGCGLGVSTAILWFFEHVEEGIILEDDCLPSPDFFTFAAVMLEFYRHDSHVMMVTGTNYHRGKYASMQGHYLSTFYPIWGWATWRRAWQHYSFSVKKMPVYELERFLQSKKIAKKWGAVFDQIIEKKLDTWDAQWVYACLKERAFCATPLQNLVSNIEPGGTHGNGSKAWVHEMPYQKLGGMSTLIQRLALRQSNRLDGETYASHGFLQQERKIRKLLRNFLKRLPLLQRALVGFRNFLKNRKL